jgi:CRISPR-associated protein Cas6
MYWQEDYSDRPYEVPDDILDVLFAIECRQLPVDHAQVLSAALRAAVPWLDTEPGAAVHNIHVAGSQNGWERPEHGGDQHLIPSRRTKLIIRVPKQRVAELVDCLRGTTLDLGGCPLTVGAAKTRMLSKEGTLLARQVVTRPSDDENAFLAWAVAELGAIGIEVRKAICGKEVVLETPDGPVRARSLMLADLSLEEAVRLQQVGLGPRRDLGCGVFIPHKGIDPVKKGSG